MNISPSDSALTYEERSESPWPTEEYRKVNSNAVVAKSLICLVLMLPTIATIRLLYERVDFECTPNNVTGVYHDTAAEDECGLKLVIAILSQLLLLPFLPETVLSSTVLAKLTLAAKWKKLEAEKERWKSRNQDSIPDKSIALFKESDSLSRIVFVDGEVGTLASTDAMEGAEKIIDIFLRYGSFSGMIMSFLFLMVFPIVFMAMPIFLIIQTVKKGGPVSGIVHFFTILYFFFLLLPDIILNIMLFPLSFLVVYSSESVSETFVNLVAVQIFAQLDDMLVRMLVHPRKSVGMILDSYCDGYIDEYRVLEKRSCTKTEQISAAEDV